MDGGRGVGLAPMHEVACPAGATYAHAVRIQLHMQAMDDQDDDYDSSIMVISTAEQCREAFGYLAQCTCMALDCEGVNLSRTGRLCLVQVWSLK